MQTIVQVLKVLKQLHSAGYAHRNIKPSNILQRLTNPEWMLVDFACCAALGAALLQCSLSQIGVSKRQPHAWLPCTVCMSSTSARSPHERLIA